MSSYTLAGATLGTLLTAVVIQLLVNPAMMWFVANHMMSIPEKIPFRKCLLCTVALTVVVIVATLCLMIPVPIVNYVIALVVWYKGSTAAIEGAFEMTSGGLTILILYTVVSVGTILAMGALA